MIILIHHSVNPYRVAFFNQLAKTKIKFKVYFLAQPAKNRKWQTKDFQLNFNHQFLKGKKFYIPGNDHSYFQLNLNIIRQLKKDKPEQIICIGWNYLATYLALIYAKSKHIKFTIWSESTAYEKSLQRFFTKPLVKLLIKLSDSYIASGNRAKDYLINLGAKENKIKLAFYTINTKQFIKQAKKYKNSSSLKALRQKLKIKKNDFLVLYLGQFIKRKGLRQLIKVIALLKNQTKLKFLLIGYGPLSEEIKRLKTYWQLDNLIIKDFIPNQDTVKYYCLNDVFILPSLEETWGLVVNEAMACFKPVLVSKYAGCSVDLVKEGKNGYIINPKDTKEIAKLIKNLANDTNKLKRMGQESVNIIENINIAQNIEIVKTITKE